MTNQCVDYNNILINFFSFPDKVNKLDVNLEVLRDKNNLLLFHGLSLVTIVTLPSPLHRGRASCGGGGIR